MPTGFDSIDNAFVRQFDSALQHACQQTVSRLTPCVTDKGTIEGESFTHNTLGSVEMDEVVTRLSPTQLSAIEHATRVANMRDFFKAIPLDKFDIPKMKINPVTGGDYISALTAARNRQKDKIIFAAFTADVQLKDGSSIALPSSQKILHSSTGFTKAKVIQAKKMFRANEADEHAGEQLYIAYDDHMLEDILADTTLTSAEFMAGRMIQEGDVARKWMGFTWVPYQGTYRGDAGYATTVAWAKSAVKIGSAIEEGDVKQRADLQNAWQTSIAGSYGALRTDEKKALSIQYAI